MSTTLLKLPDGIQQKVNAAAIDLDITQHIILAETIPKAATVAETHTAFISTAQTTHTTTMASGLSYSAHKVHQRLHDCIKEKIDIAKTKSAVVHTKLSAKS